jgi:hypothetical protein
VGRTTGCPWHERWKELGFKEDFCSISWDFGTWHFEKAQITFKIREYHKFLSTLSTQFITTWPDTGITAGKSGYQNFVLLDI